MAIGRYVTIAVKVVKQDKLFGQLVVIGSDVTPEHHEGRVAVTPREVAKNLVVSPVLFDDIKNMFNRRWVAHTGGNRRLLGMRSVSQQLVGIGAVAVDRLCVSRQGLLVGN